MIDQQKMQLADRMSRLIVKQGMLIESGLSDNSFITSPIGRKEKMLKRLSVLPFDPWHAVTGLCIMCTFLELDLTEAER